MTKQSPPTVALIGNGEAATAFVSGWQSEAGDIRSRAFDIDPARTQTRSRAGALDGAQLVFSLVTADQARIALEQAQAHLARGALVLDCNSCSPDTKRASAELVAQAGGRYVDVAVMAPVRPLLHKTPLLISGEHAGAALPKLAALGMKARVIEGGVGAASSVKMVRSIMIKGLEALAMECVLAGTKAGVEAEVLDSLNRSMPEMDWGNRAEYMMERMTTHGIRRASEMREVVKTVHQLGLPAHMARAAVDWQQRAGEMQIPAPETAPRRTRQILAALSNKKESR